MAFIPCDEYYEYILGDNCDNDCAHCLGNKDIRICIHDFQIVGESVLHTKKVDKNTAWACKFESDDHLILDDLYGNELYISKKLYDKNFGDLEIRR